MDNKEKTIEQAIADNLCKYLDLKNKKRADLALYLDTSISAISRFCLNKSTPTVSQLVKICKFLEISLNDLFGIEDSSTLSDDEVRFIEALRDNPEAYKYIKQFLNIK